MAASKKKIGRPSKVPVRLRKTSTAHEVLSQPETPQTSAPVSRPRPKPLWATTASGTDHAAPSKNSVLLASTTAAELEAGEALVALLQAGGTGDAQMIQSRPMVKDVVGGLEMDSAAGEEQSDHEIEEDEDESIVEVPGK
jgi:hypothetical protein